MCDTGTGEQVAQLLDSYMMMMMMKQNGYCKGRYCFDGYFSIKIPVIEKKKKRIKELNSEIHLIHFPFSDYQNHS
jgi:hypothetical protein